jgi:4-aminobutyrate aminotransferase-like enzyme
MSEDGLVVQRGLAVFPPASHHYYPFAIGLLERCLAKGLILIGCGLKRNVVRFIPPLTVSAEEMAQALDIFAAALAEVS